MTDSVLVFYFQTRSFYFYTHVALFRCDRAPWRLEFCFWRTVARIGRLSPT